MRHTETRKGGVIMKFKVKKVEEVSPTGFNGWG